MKILEPIPQCIDCLTSLARDAVKFGGCENPSLKAEAEQITRRILSEAGGGRLNSPQIANQILREIRRITGIEDPYATFKAREMSLARRMFTGLESLITSSLRSRAEVAALGNSLDFFKSPEQALAEIPDLLRAGISFYFDHLDQLARFLEQRPRTILYFTDNAGEIYFDGPLYEYLKKRCRQIYLVVKGGPGLNDLTRVELQSAQLADKFEPVADTGTDGAGVDWNHVSREFRALLAQADLIVSKGMANFETLYPPTLDVPSFFLFKVKCAPIQNFIQAPGNSFLALWKQGCAA
jgi:uncharacterized protein with ATP-grasp and redox domains